MRTHVLLLVIVASLGIQSRSIAVVSAQSIEPPLIGLVNAMTLGAEVVVAVGQDVALLVVQSFQTIGWPGLATFVWQISTDHGASWNDLRIAAPYSTSGYMTNRSAGEFLHISKATVSLSGVQYRVVATNAAGSMTSNIVTLRVTGCDMNGDGREEIVTGAGPGGGPHVLVFSLAGGAPTTLASFYAYDPAFAGGVYVACGDVNGDGRSDVVTGAGSGGGPHVRAFSVPPGGTGITEVASFFAYDSSFGGGVRVAAGDVNGDGVADIVTGAGPGGGPHVRAFSLRNGVATELVGFYAYDPSVAGGVTVVSADVTGDGVAEIITGTVQVGGPLRVFQIGGPAATAELTSFYPYSPRFPGEVRVAAADVDGDHVADIITGAGRYGGPHVRAFSLADGSVVDLASFYAYDPLYCDLGGSAGALSCEGVYVAGADVTGDGRAEIITGNDQTAGPVRVFQVRGGVVALTSFFAYGPYFPGPVRVAAAVAPPGDGLLSACLSGSLPQLIVPSLLQSGRQRGLAKQTWPGSRVGLSRSPPRVEPWRTAAILEPVMSINSIVPAVGTSVPAST